MRKDMRRRRQGAGIALVAALASFIGLLLTANYVTGRSLARSRIDGLRADVERCRTLLGSFFAERRSDLADLAASSDVQAYFQNRALGMSPEYGLDLSLAAMRRRVAELVERAQIGHVRIYHRLAIVDGDGTTLVDSAAEAGPGIAPVPRLPDVDEGPLASSPDRHDIVVVQPCLLGGAPVARLVAYMPARELLAQFHGFRSAEAVERVATEGDADHDSDGVEGYLLWDVARGAAVGGTPPRGLDSRLAGSRAAGVVGPEPLREAGSPARHVLHAAVPGTPLALVHVVSQADLERGIAPGRQLLALALVALLLLVGGAWTLRLNTRAVALSARLDESMRREAEIEAQHRELEREVTERRRIELELKAATAAAEAASRAKSEFLANVSHEIRTPLNGILGFTDILLDAPLPDEQRDLLRIVRTSGDTLLALIDDLLDVSKIESGQLVLEHTAFDPRRVLSDVAQLIAPRLAGRPIELRVIAADALPARVTADPFRLRQIALNLAGNAAKFTTSGSITMTLDAAPRGADWELRFVIEDTGIGIPADKLGVIFEAFRQADASTTRRFGGTGLGLTICRALVDAMGGTIEATSTVGRGSTFAFTVPAARAADLPDAATAAAPDGTTPAGQLPEPAAGSAAARPCDGPGARILLVEDNPVNQRLALMLLERAGHQVDVAWDGRQAIEKIDAAPDAYDLVLMDIQMPVLDGLGATRELRARGCRLPILALTANAMKGDAELCVACGMDGHVAKPFRRDELLREVHRFARAPAGPR